MEIATYKNNSVYRMGDVINATGVRWVDDRLTILSSPEYEDTILRHFVEHLIYLKPKDAANLDYWGMLREITMEHAIRKEHRLPTKSDIVMHLRLGDILAEKEESQWRMDETMGYFDRWRRESILNYYEDFFKRIELKENYPKHTLRIVTALHFGANDKNNKYFYSAEAEGKSLRVLESIEKQLNDLDYRYEIISQETDADFAYMINSKIFIKGMSGMSELVEKCLMDDAKIIREKTVMKPNFKFQSKTIIKNSSGESKVFVTSPRDTKYDQLTHEEQDYIDEKIKRDLIF